MRAFRTDGPSPAIRYDCLEIAHMMIQSLKGLGCPVGDAAGLELGCLEARRLRAGELFATGVRQAEVSRQLGVPAQAVSVWHARWEDGGPEALRSRIDLPLGEHGTAAVGQRRQQVHRPVHLPAVGTDRSASTTGGSAAASARWRHSGWVRPPPHPNCASAAVSRSWRTRRSRWRCARRQAPPPPRSPAPRQLMAPAAPGPGIGQRPESLQQPARPSDRIVVQIHLHPHHRPRPARPPLRPQSAVPTPRSIRTGIAPTARNHHQRRTTHQRTRRDPGQYPSVDHRYGLALPAE